MGDVTDDELLRLARKAWPHEDQLDVARGVRENDDCVVTDGYGYTQARVSQHERARQALYAALLVLAGELDIEAVGGALKLTGLRR